MPPASAFGSVFTHPSPTSRGLGCCVSFLTGRWCGQTANGPRAGAVRLRRFFGGAGQEMGNLIGERPGSRRGSPERPAGKPFGKPAGETAGKNPRKKPPEKTLIFRDIACPCGTSNIALALKMPASSLSLPCFSFHHLAARLSSLFTSRCTAFARRGRSPARTARLPFPLTDRPQRPLWARLPQAGKALRIL